MNILKKYWWIIALLLIAAVVAYFVFQPGVQQTALSGAKGAMSGGTILK